MASNTRNSDQNDPLEDQPIPLQDLSGQQNPLSSEGRGRRRTSSGSSSIGSIRRTFMTGGPVTTYERILEDSPSPTERTAFNPARPTDITAEQRRSPYLSDEELASPTGDPALFAQAANSVGLSFDPSQRASFPMPIPQLTVGDSDSQEMVFDAAPEGPAGLHDDSTYEDTTPLTDKRYLQPISGASAPEDEQQERSSLQSVRFSGSRLGDDLPNLEGGFGGRRRGSSSAGENGRRSRSLSPSASSSALSRAGSVMRMMSQRVVNLSNEPEIVEQTIKHKNSLKNARLEEPPTLPAMPEYAHDEEQEQKKMRTAWKTQSNPLRGKSLGIFAPDNSLRMWLCDVLVHPFTEPFILVVIVVQTVLLAVGSAQSVFDHPLSTLWGSSWFDYAFSAIFIIYTLELIARIVVSGLIINPAEYSTLNRSLGLKKALAEKGRNIFTPHRQLSTRKNTTSSEPQMSVLRTFTGLQSTGMWDDPLQRQRVRLAHRAFLRHSFNRLDFVAVVSFWISFILSATTYNTQYQTYVFRMLSCLRILRLLQITNGTSIILRSLKKAAPLLVHVAFLIGFFWLLFAIVGIQSFKSSLRRTCVWVDPLGQNNYTLNDPYSALQFCGGYLNQSNGNPMSWLYANGAPSQFVPKGYLCPEGSLCMEGSNPYNGTVSFDNILQSLELVFVIMTSNTFADLLYFTTYTDYLASAIFFICGIVFLSLWMVNLLVAVITSSFQVIREESKRSAFAIEKIDNIDLQEKTPRKSSNLKRWFDKTKWLWIAVITFDLVVQCLRSDKMGADRKEFIDVTETVVTFSLILEITLRFLADWRCFHKSRRNLVDLGLAVITGIIQIPPIRNSGEPYAVLTVFQVLRIYRVILAFSLTRDLIVIVFRNAVGLLNLILFVFLITFLAAIFAVQLFRGWIPNQNPNQSPFRVTFNQIYNSFLGMYQILSSENWTTILYSVTMTTVGTHASWISATFFIMWLIVANFIILNMFIAVIQESFDVSEDEKRLQQVKAFLQQKHFAPSSTGNLALTSIFKLGRDSSRYKDPLDHGPANLELLLKDAVVWEFLNEHETLMTTHRTDSPIQTAEPAGIVQPGVLSKIWAKISLSLFHGEPNPFYSRLKFSRAYEELDARTMAKEVVSASEKRKIAQREYLRKHPRYNKSLFIFAPNNPIRRACQRIVGPGRGQQRFEGVDPYKPLWYSFSAFIYAAIVAMVLLACVMTPLFQREHFQNTTYNWFVWADIGFAALFSVEAIIKVVADGFFWTPNAYFRGSWGFIDGVVLITLWVNVVTVVHDNSSVSRFVGAFKALRALRLLNVSDSARDTFHAVIIVGGWKVISAAFVSLSFLIPFAIYGLTLFNGKMKACNDPTVSSLDTCIGEYQNSPYYWNVLAPRSVSNPYFDFDNFPHSLFILFQIVSQEGWVDVQWAAMSITGVGLQPQPFATQANGIFFVIFNLLGAVFVLTLFVSVFMRNYTEQTGVAYLTADQRSWLELRKLLRQISPSKRSVSSDSQRWKAWCYRIAVKKHGKWAKSMTAILLLHLLLLILEFYPQVSWWDLTREGLFLLFTFFYIANIVIRFFGLGWHRFSRSSWDIYSVVSVSGAFATTLLGFIFTGQIFDRFNKLFLVSITLLLIPRNNQLDQLFKTAAASLTAIGNLLATWLVLFLVFAIAMTQTLGLTKLGANESSNINFRDVQRALIFLFRASCGEGWNQLMEDFATMRPPYCTPSDNFLNSDCGSAAWARSLFIAWNIISMYIFVSLFVSLIFESFSYVYQRKSGLYAISREDIRRFKQAWATFDPDGTGYISKEQFPRLLGELSGVFEMRIYDGEFTVGSILEQCRLRPRDSSLPHNNHNHNKGSDEVDLKKLASIVNRIPVDTIISRRKRLNTFYEEMLVSADPDRGIAFSGCLMILAHYNVINDSQSLRLEEFLRRRARLQRVEEAVRRNTVIGFFDTLYWYRRFRHRLDSRESARLRTVPQFAVPEIFVDSQDDDDVTSADHTMTSSAPSSPQRPPQPRRRGYSSPGSGGLHIDTDVQSRNTGASSSSEWIKVATMLSPHRTTMNVDTEYHGATGLTTPVERLSGHSRESSSVSVQDVMESLDNSAWGQSIRRSFTRRRSRD